MSLTSKGHFMIGSTEFVAKKLDPNYESLQGHNSGRTDDGVMHIDWVLRKVRKIQIEMPPCTASEASAILSLVQGKEYYLTYFDVLANEEKTIYVYTSNSKAECYSGVLYDGLYQGIAFNAIEIGGENDD